MEDALMDGREVFKLKFLLDAAFDDFQGLWEPVRRLRRSRPELADEQLTMLAEAGPPTRTSWSGR
jgi:hypothetical protein